MLDVAGATGANSPQTQMALAEFHRDPAVTALYGFSGGGYNLKHVLDFLASHKPEPLHRIELVVVIGSPNKVGGKSIYLPSFFQQNWQNQEQTSGGCKVGGGLQDQSPSIATAEGSASPCQHTYVRPGCFADRLA